MVTKSGFVFKKLFNTIIRGGYTYEIYQYRFPSDDGCELLYKIGLVAKNPVGSSWWAFKNNIQNHDYVGRYRTRLAAAQALSKLYQSLSVPVVES